MASIYERSGRYYAQFYDSSKSPSRKRLSLKTEKKRDARRKLVDLEDAYEQGAFDPWADGVKSDPFNYESAGFVPYTTESVISAFVETKKQQGCSERTIDTYQGVWRRFTEQIGLETNLTDLSPANIRDFCHDESVAQATRHMRWRHIRAVLSWADCDIIQKVDAPRKADKLPTPVRPDDLKRITGEVRREYRELRNRNQCRPGQLIWAIPVFRWAFYTGMRATEIGRLRWRDINRERGLIRITRQKNNREQTIPLISKAASVLDSAPPEQGPGSYVFRTPNGPTHDRNPKSFGEAASRRFCKARRAAEIERNLTFHDLRAGFATALADAGMSAHMIKEAMRHADLSTALKYVNVSRKRLRDEMEEAIT